MEIDPFEYAFRATSCQRGGFDIPTTQLREHPNSNFAHVARSCFAFPGFAIQTPACLVEKPGELFQPLTSCYPCLEGFQNPAINMAEVLGFPP